MTQLAIDTTERHWTPWMGVPLPEALRGDEPYPGYNAEADEFLSRMVAQEIDRGASPLVARERAVFEATGMHLAEIADLSLEMAELPFVTRAERQEAEYLEAVFAWALNGPDTEEVTQ